jgi:hypothetical protein
MKSSIGATTRLIFIEKGYIIIETRLRYGNLDCQSEDDCAMLDT